MNESDHQKALITWARLSIGKYPELKYLYAIPNGGKRSIVTATRLKAEGAKAGVSDLHLPVPRGGYHGLWIEMKTETGKLSDAQREWLEGMESLGHMAVVARGWDLARAVIINYLKG